MIGPHQGELHAIAVLGAEEALLQGFLHVLHTAIPVPVEEEYVDTVVNRKVDFTCRPFRIALVETPPRRLQWLVVSGKARNRRFHALPLGPPFTFPGTAVIVVVPVRVIDGHHARSPCPGFGGRICGRGTGDDRQARGHPDHALLRTIQELATVDGFHGKAYLVQKVVSGRR